MASEPMYCTREEVKTALDYKETARNNAQVDRNIKAASRSVERQLRRKFYPLQATRYFDWPNERRSPAWKLWLDQYELISATLVSSAGIAIPPTDYFLEPANDGPPYDQLQINVSRFGRFDSGNTWQHSVAIVGLWGFTADEEPAGTITADITTVNGTAVNIANSASVGVGSIIRVDTERMQVTGRSMLTTGQTVLTPLTAANNNDIVQVANGAAYSIGEVLLVDSERMLIVDSAGNNLVVKRAWDGTVLAAHTGSTIYALRTLTVERGALGTTAATHTSGAAVAKHMVPSLVTQLTIAESISSLQQESAGWGRTAGSGDNQRELFGRGLAKLRTDAISAYGRAVLFRSV